MLFNIDADEGFQIVGWVIPDNPGAAAEVICVFPDGKELHVPATIERPAVVEFGFHHSTGLIGFKIDEELVPNLRELQEFQLLEGSTRILIYSRFRISQHLEKKLCFYELSLMPQRRIMSSLGSHFALTYNHMQRYALETTTMIVNNPTAKSLLLTGRPNYLRQHGMLRNAGFMITALLRDPFEELAERLIFIDLLASKAAHLLQVFVTDIQPLVEFARNLPWKDSRAMTSKFRGATPEQRQAMTSPMTRAFGCSIDEVPEYKHVSIALDNLGGMDVVGTHARFADFRAVLTDVLGTDIIGQSQLEVFNQVKDAREILMQIGIVSDLLESDCALYAFASKALDEGLDGI